MAHEVLEKVTALIKENPKSGQSLLLFALSKTLDIEKGGHMYMLAKLKEMTPKNRQLAYGLMELMADNQIHDEDWRQQILAMETAIRG